MNVFACPGSTPFSWKSWSLLRARRASVCVQVALSRNRWKVEVGKGRSARCEIYLTSPGGPQSTRQAASFSIFLLRLHKSLSTLWLPKTSGPQALPAAFGSPQSPQEPWHCGLDGCQDPCAFQPTRSFHGYAGCFHSGVTGRGGPSSLELVSERAISRCLSSDSGNQVWSAVQCRLPRLDLRRQAWQSSALTRHFFCHSCALSGCRKGRTATFGEITVLLHVVPSFTTRQSPHFKVRVWLL